MNGTSSTYLSSFFPPSTRLAFSRSVPLTDAPPSTRSFRDWNAGMSSSTPPPFNPPTQVLCVSAPTSEIPQPVTPKRNPHRAARDKGTEGGAKKTRSTSSISPEKRVRNRNNVLIECTPCKGVMFTRKCIYQAHLKSKRHANNVAGLNAQLYAERPVATPCGQASQPGPSFASAPASASGTDPVATFDYTLCDFGNLDYSPLNLDSNGTSDTSSSDLGSQDSEISFSPSLADLWNAPAPAPEVPLQATLSIVGGSSSTYHDGSVVNGFFYPGNGIFVPLTL